MCGTAEVLGGIQAPENKSLYKKMHQFPPAEKVYKPEKKRKP